MEHGNAGSLRSLLDPWIQRAGSRVDVTSTLDVFASSADVHRDLWVEWHVPTQGDADIVDVEAMELLELYAHVDYEAAWRLILELACNDECVSLILDNIVSRPEDRVYPRFEVRNLQAMHVRGTLKEFVRWFILHIAPSDHSSHYEETRHQLHKHAEENGTSHLLRQPGERIPVKFAFDLTLCSFSSRLLEDVASLAAVAQDPRRRQVAAGRVAHAAKPSDVFVVHSVVPHFMNGQVTDEMLVSLQAISSSWNVPVESLALGAAQFAPDGVSPRRVAKFLRAMLLSAASKTSIVDVTPRLAIEVAKAMCSVLVKSQSVEVLTSGRLTEPANRQTLWIWLAYAVFSWEATNQIKRLDLRVEDLTDKNVAIFEQVVRARDPLVFIAPSSDGSDKLLERVPAAVDVGPNAALLVAVDTTKEHLIKIKTGDKVESLRVVEDSPDSHFISVMYPGIGVCWLNRDAIIERHTLSPPTLTAPNKVERLSLAVSLRTSMDALVRMVKLIGQNVRTLTVQCIMDELLVPGRVLEAVLAACPGLRRLELSRIRVPDFRWLTSCTQLEALHLDGVECVEPNEHTRLLEEISTRRMSVTSFHLQSTDDVFTEIKDAMVALLDSSRVLERFFISYDYDDYESGIPPIPEQAADLKPRNGVPLNVQKMPLPLRNKLAFISTMQETNDLAMQQQESRSSIVTLDAEMIAIIFRFAAPHKTRVCGAIPFKEVW